jgi:hypothetical protein
MATRNTPSTRSSSPRVTHMVTSRRRRHWPCEFHVPSRTRWNAMHGATDCNRLPQSPPPHLISMAGSRINTPDGITPRDLLPAARCAICAVYRVPVPRNVPPHVHVHHHVCATCHTPHVPPCYVLCATCYVCYCPCQLSGLLPAASDCQHYYQLPATRYQVPVPVPSSPSPPPPSFPLPTSSHRWWWWPLRPLATLATGATTGYWLLLATGYWLLVVAAAAAAAAPWCLVVLAGVGVGVLAAAAAASCSCALSPPYVIIFIVPCYYIG